MIAYKFLAAGRHGRFSGFSWPEPGTWVHTNGPLDACRTGVHACGIEGLPWWLDDELWTVELSGGVVERGNQMVGRSGRLVARIDGWTPQCAQDYADACARRGGGHVASALRGAGRPGEAELLENAGSIEELRVAAAELAPQHADTRIALMMARDGARRALTGAAPTAAYIAAHTAARVGGPDAYAAERIWQAEWLAERLGLSR